VLAKQAILMNKLFEKPLANDFVADFAQKGFKYREVVHPLLTKFALSAAVTGECIFAST